MKQITALLGIAMIAVVIGYRSHSIAAGQESSDPVASHLHAVLMKQQDAWNRGDLESFMDAYLRDPKLTFSGGGETTRGWDATLERYRKRYPDRATMGTLKFSHLETELLGETAALTLGRWHLDREKSAEGNFSLVWKKTDQGWRIIHDHSSSVPQKP